MSVKKSKRRVRLGVALLLAGCTGSLFANPFAVDDIPSSDKGDFRYSSVGVWPETEINLDPIQREIGLAAASQCGTGLAAAPLDFGKTSGFLGRMAGKLASAAASQLIGGLLGGGGGGKGNDGPPLNKDPIKSRGKAKFVDKETGTRLKAGSRMFSDALLLSAEIDRSRSKGTFHTIFLEKSDCTRIFPEDTWGYKRWGKWSLSVSVTKTTRSYQDGNLVNESVNQSGWSKSGTFDPSKVVSIFGVDDDTQALQLTLDPKLAFLNQLKSELDSPLWQTMGYNEPRQGLRSVGAAFPGLTLQDIGNDTVAIVHVTHLKKGRYRTVGFPLKLIVGKGGKISLQQLPIEL